MSEGLITGVATPRTGSSLRPFVLAYAPHFEHIFLIPTTLSLAASQLRDSFLQKLPQPSIDNPVEFESVTELVARFLAHVTERVSEAGEGEDFLVVILIEFENRFLRGNEVHAIITELEADKAKKKDMIRAYYTARVLAHREIKGHQSALLRAARNGEVNLFAIFGGQGFEDYFEELRELYNMYETLIAQFVQHMASIIQELAKHSDVKKVYSEGMNIMDWIRNPEATPSDDYLISTPVSFPLIGVVQLTHYAVACRVLGLEPGGLRDQFRGATGHSQGIVTAVAISASTDWPSFLHEARTAVSILFWIGCRSQQHFPVTTLPPAVLKDSLVNNEGVPTPMLSVRDLVSDQVQKYIDLTNEHLPRDKHISIALINGPRNLVVVGPPHSLHGLNLALRKLKASPGLEQGRIPYSERKLRFTNRFLAISCPFHSFYLKDVAKVIAKDLETYFIDSKNLAFPVYHTNTGADLRDCDNLIQELINMITFLPVNWEKATVCKDISHIVDFGPGGVSGLGTLTHRNKDGTGVRIILAGALEGGNVGFGFKPELFDRADGAVKYNPDWLKSYRPSLISTTGGKTYFNTAFSRLTGKPPLLVAGMTPATVSWEFVTATTNAGYYIELAGGGYISPEKLSDAIINIEANTPAGAGIVVNIIYINPLSFQWQVDLVKTLRSEGVPIEGVCIGAGIPSLDVANELIATLGVKYIGLKPGSSDGIQQVVAIAKANPLYPIICQWTGGRAGGHHSYEDFHQPILQMYSTVRRCPNIILIAGSGFGGADDTFPYLTGEWALKFAHPPMPFDGVLFGSRMMTAKEARTSLPAKQAIVDAPGASDEEWEKTYKRPTGGIVTVISELGEPIHKLATRGVMLWKELDETVFNLPKEKRTGKLKEKRDYIIKRLNEDFQRVWFGMNSKGEACDLEDMTYGEITCRLVELMYVRKEDRWIDISLRNLMGDWIRRVEERFTPVGNVVSFLQHYSALDNINKTIEDFFRHVPEANTQLINAQDVQHFLMLCQRRGQKPVPFIPVLDKDFEVWFKKDSLWQSEDIAAVVDEDVQRTCILQGPLAASHNKIINEPVKDILDSIHNRHIAALKELYYREVEIPVVEYFGGQDPSDGDAVLYHEAVEVLEESAERIQYRLVANVSNTGLPSLNEWLAYLAGSKRSWRTALFLSDVFLQGTKLQNNPVKELFKPRWDQKVEILHPRSPDHTCITIYDKQTLEDDKAVSAFVKNNIIHVVLYERRNACDTILELPLLFTYHPENGYAPIREILEGRNDRIKQFYWKLWFGTEPMPKDAIVTDVFKGGEVKITRNAIADFVHAVGNRSEAYIPHNDKQTQAPMDFAIVLGWKAVMKSVFPRAIDGDLLKLVHLSNGFKVYHSVKPLETGDVISTEARVNAVLNGDSGKTVEVLGTIIRGGQIVMEIVTQFFYRGRFEDFENTFQRRNEIPMQVELNTLKDVAVLTSKEWFHLDSEVNLLNTVLTFRLQSFTRFKNKTHFDMVETYGSVELELNTKEIVQIASISYQCGESQGNPVLSYLKRHGKPIEQPMYFDGGGYSVMPDPSILTGDFNSPATNISYATASGDYNPIHVNRYFASYAALPGTITHGMWTSAATRTFVETFAAENKAERVKVFNATFLSMVLPSTRLETKLSHIGMVQGRKIIKVETFDRETGTKVLDGTAEIDQPVTAYVFTGQGSQEQGMGMDLYESSAVARAIWDKADRHFLSNYGFSILHIVKNNPKELTVYFGGPKGKAIRQNYLNMVYEVVESDGSIKPIQIFKGINEKTTSYQFKSPGGLLSATQFTQPALTLMEKAAFEDMKSRGLVQRDCVFAGHSLGEYSALAAIGDVLPIESLVDVVFYRGLTMQVAVPRDASGRSEYGMCAVNPSRISHTFNESALKYVVEQISSTTSWLLEIVNYNVENQQYVCAGNHMALQTLGNVLNLLKQQKIDLDKLLVTLSLDDVTKQLNEIIGACAEKSRQAGSKGPLELERGYATIPLKGIDVPFHSTFLRNGVRPFRSYLSKKITRSQINPALLLNRYIPNVTAKPFEISKEYFQEVHKLTGSPRLKSILDNWQRYEQGGD